MNVSGFVLSLLEKIIVELLARTFGWVVGGLTESEVGGVMMEKSCHGRGRCSSPTKDHIIRTIR